MVDPKQNSKRGFGEFAAREHESSDARTAATEQAMSAPGAKATVTVATDSTASTADTAANIASPPATDPAK